MKAKIFFLLIVMFVLNGFSNARELNELAIASAIGIDYDTKTNEYIITAQILNNKKENSSGSGSGSSNSSSEIVVINSKSPSVQSALRNIIEESPKKLYLAHMKLLLISEKMAKSQDILDTLNFFIRDNEGSNDFMMVITRNTTPQKVLEILTPLESNPAENIVDSIITSNRYKGIASVNTLSDNVAMFLENGKSSVAVSIEIDEDEIIGSKDELNDNKIKDENYAKNSNENNENNDLQISSSDDSSKKDQNDNKNAQTKKIKVSNLAYFKDHFLTGYIEDEENYIYNLITKNAKGGIIQIGEKENLLVIEQTSVSTKLKPRRENDKFIIDLSINLSCNVTETGKNVDFKTKEKYKINQNYAKEYLTEKIEKFISNTKEKYDCDLIGAGNIFYKFDNKDYELLMLKYGDQYYKYIDYNVSLNVDFPTEGGVHDL
ncbi:germination protein Ger(X)C family [Clostridium sp. CAG:921]|nr:germination protein Ger(X)C family [Clostridium sp. CAG:921]